MYQIFRTITGPRYCIISQICIVTLFAIQLKAQQNIFQAGASISDITPPLGSSIVGGYNIPSATFIHDPLNVRTLVLDDGNKQLIFSIVDNVSIKREIFDAAKQIIKEKFGIERENILMAATHTHSAASLRGNGDCGGFDEYQSLVINRIVQGVSNALHNKRPAKIAFGSVDIPEHVFNRRWFMKDSVYNPFGMKEIVKMNPGYSDKNIRPAGPVDPEVSFIAVESLSGDPIALLANYSLHYVGYVPKGEISADYFAVFSNRMKELLSKNAQYPEFVGMMSNGTSGNINNNDYSRPSNPLPPYEKIKYVANDVADKVYEAYQNLNFEKEVKLTSARSEIKLKSRRATPEMLSNIAQIRDSEEILFNRLEKIYVYRIFRMEADYPDSVDIELQTFGINDVGIAAIPFEVFSQTGLRLKSESPFSHSFTIELANGANGYLPTPEQHKLGGYETWLAVNRVEKEASVKIENEILKLFQKIH